MQVEKQTILEMIRVRADGDAALARAQEVLPERFDTDDYLGELEKLGLSPEDLGSDTRGTSGSPPV